MKTWNRLVKLVWTPCKDTSNGGCKIENPVRGYYSFFWRWTNNYSYLGIAVKWLFLFYTCLCILNFIIQKCLCDLPCAHFTLERLQVYFSSSIFGCWPFSQSISKSVCRTKEKATVEKRADIICQLHSQDIQLSVINELRLLKLSFELCLSSPYGFYLSRSVQASSDCFFFPVCISEHAVQR